MGGCQSSEEDVQSKKLNKTLKHAQQEDAKSVKILLLGAGESGKSTIFKQMKILHKHGYDDVERQSFVRTIHGNIFQNMSRLLDGANQLGIGLPSDLQESADSINQVSNSNPVVTAEDAVTIKKLWESESLQKAYSRRSEFQLGDSAEYYFQDVDRISSPSYSPTDQDILRTRVRTTGVVESEFMIEKVLFRMFDVGGQRNERRKWIHCFEEVHAVLFVAALSEYDQKLFEDENQNRMKEALNLFGEICNSRYFEKTAMILFLNKKDLFEAKLPLVSLNVCFPAYDGGDDYESAVEFIKEEFFCLNQNPELKKVYCHVTCATDTNNVKFVFAAVKDIILNQNLSGSGFV